MERKSLKEIRVEAKKSKLEFSKMLGIPYTTYVRYEENLEGAPFGIVARICEVLGLKIEEIRC